MLAVFQIFIAGPSQDERRPPRGAAIRAAAERGGDFLKRGRREATLTSVAVLATLVVGCGQAPRVADVAAAMDSAFTVQGAGGTAIARVLTRAATCPAIAWDGATPTPMLERVAPARVPPRSGEQSDSKAADFPVRVCEAPWPAHAQSAHVAGVTLPAPARNIQRITIVADTGCRMKGSENAFQACNDATAWPFARVAVQAAATKPDLVIHIGDMHYRESPCPTGNAGCANSPWGYGYDVWKADFFQPARPLLTSAPWVFVRGNHESCSRAGQGWLRFFDLQPWSEQRSCNAPQWDAQGDFSPPYAVPLSRDAQLVVFDSAATAGKPLKPTDAAYAPYVAQMGDVARLAAQAPTSFFLSHHPVLAFAPSKKSGAVNPGNAGLQSVMALTEPQRLFPRGIDVAMHGHVHLFEALSFSSPHPATLVLGNSGSDNLWDRSLPKTLPANAAPYPGAVVEDFATTFEYGFATLDREDPQDASRWLLTEYNADGKPTIRCRIHQGKSRCTPVTP